jgi:hypothetical protein
MLSGWKKAFSDSLKKRDGILHQTLVRANAKLDGPIFSSPAHLTSFDEALLKCLEVEKTHSILSTLHFGIEVAKTSRGVFLMCAHDMEALDVNSQDIVMAVDTKTGQWCAGQVREHAKCIERSIVISENDAEIVGFRNSSVVNVVKIENEIPELTKLILSYSGTNSKSNMELVSSLHFHNHEILENLDGIYVGVGSKLRVGPGTQPIKLSIRHTEPELKAGQIGKISSKNILLRPSQSFRELNIVICISTGKDMSKRDVSVKTLSSLKRQLDELSGLIPEVKKFLRELDNNPTRAEIAAIAALLAVNLISHNRTEGNLGLVTFSDTPDKFSIQHGSEIQSYIEFLGDLQSEEVLVSLVYSILDAIRTTGGHEQIKGAYRSIAEYLEDFGSSRPTLVLVFSGDIGKYDEENLPFIQAVKENERYQTEFFTFDEASKQKSSLRLLKGVNARVIPIESFSSHLFIGHLLDVIDRLVPRTANLQPDV